MSGAAGRRPSKTELRRGLVEQIRRPVTVMRPLSAEELDWLNADPEDDVASPHGLHDSVDPPRDPHAPPPVSGPGRGPSLFDD